MDTRKHIDEAVDTLQQLGLKEYEAKCFVGLSRMATGTAKELSEITDVPRTRVYDAIRVLEGQGLVEVQHSSPQQFRAVPIDEATETLRGQYETRVRRVEQALERVEPVEDPEDAPVQEVWSISGGQAIENRTSDLVSEADEEVVLVVGDPSLVTDSLAETLRGLDDVDLLVGATNDAVKRRVEEAAPDATTFASGLEWLHGADAENETAVGRLLLVDRSTILVSSILPESGDEQAIFGEGFGNGLVVVARRLMAQGLLESRDPGTQ
ncbi:MAG: TrmB family transcriptional regulator [Halobacteriaceae archaeon]